MSKGTGKVSSNTHSKSELNHYSNQNNTNSEVHKSENNNHSNQLNPNNKK